MRGEDLLSRASKFDAEGSQIGAGKICRKNNNCKQNLSSQGLKIKADKADLPFLRDDQILCPQRSDGSNLDGAKNLNDFYERQMTQKARSKMAMPQM